MTSKIIESLRGDLAALRDAGAISKVTMRKFDAIGSPLSAFSRSGMSVSQQESLPSREERMLSSQSSEPRGGFGDLDAV